MAKNIPSEWIDKIVVHYKLNNNERSELTQAIEESRTQYKIVSENSGIYQCRAALEFARSFENLDDVTAIKILKLLEK